MASGGQEQEACDCGSRVWQRWCRKRERKVATARAVLHGRRAATARGMPQCMVSILRPQMFIYFFFFLQFANVCVHSLDLSDLMVYKARS